MGNSLNPGAARGIRSASRRLRLGKLVMVCWIGSFAGDAVRFFIGRRFGSKWLSWFPRIERALQMTTRLVEHHYSWFVFLYRYPNGIRSLAGFAFGFRAFRRGPSCCSISFPPAVVAHHRLGRYAFSKLTDKMVNDAASGLGMALLIGFLALFMVSGKPLDRALEKS
jgi:hypothetical protein